MKSAALKYLIFHLNIFIVVIMTNTLLVAFLPPTTGRPAFDRGNFLTIIATLQFIVLSFINYKYQMCYFLLFLTTVQTVH